MPHTLSPLKAFELGRTLQPLSDQGILIIGSGSITHNLHEFSLDAQGEESYAKAFMRWVRDKALQRDVSALIEAKTQAPYAARAHPTNEHYLPFLIALGAARPGAKLQVIDGGLTYRVIGMDSYIWRPA